MKARVHAAAEEGVAFRSIAEAIGRGLDVPVKSIPAEQMADILGGFLGVIAQLDNLTSSARTRELLGWRPIALSVDLDAETRARVARFTGEHVGQRVELRLAGRSVATLLVRDPIDVPSLLLTGRDDAEVRGMQRDLGAP